MGELVDLRKNEDELNTVFKRFDPGFNSISFGRYEDLVYKLLELAMDDKYDYISYWLYDLDCGRKYKKGCITDSKNKPIPLKTLSELYDAI